MSVIFPETKSYRPICLLAYISAERGKEMQEENVGLFQNSSWRDS